VADIGWITAHYLRRVRPIGQRNHDSFVRENANISQFRSRFDFSFDLKCLRYIILVFPTGRYWETVKRPEIIQFYLPPFDYF
jgi:hypothetical protein